MAFCLCLPAFSAAALFCRRLFCPPALGACVWDGGKTKGSAPVSKQGRSQTSCKAAPRYHPVFCLVSAPGRALKSSADADHGQTLVLPLTGDAVPAYWRFAPPLCRAAKDSAKKQEKSPVQPGRSKGNFRKGCPLAQLFCCHPLPQKAGEKRRRQRPAQALPAGCGSFCQTAPGPFSCAENAGVLSFITAFVPLIIARGPPVCKRWANVVI